MGRGDCQASILFQSKFRQQVVNYLLHAGDVGGVLPLLCCSARNSGMSMTLL